MDTRSLNKTLPSIGDIKRIKASNFFNIEQLDLTFSNGHKATYERLYGGNGAVLAVPFDGRDFYLISEYSCGTHSYELGFVKGKVDKGETSEHAVSRELQEEIGYKSNKITLLKKHMTVAPGMMSLLMDVYLCEDLEPHKLDGDEPEPIEIVKVGIDEVYDLIFSNTTPLREARSIAALVMAMHQLRAI